MNRLSLVCVSALLLSTGFSFAFVACSESTSGLGAVSANDAAPDSLHADVGADSTMPAEAGEAGAADTGMPDMGAREAGADSGERDAMQDATGDGAESDADGGAEAAADASCDGGIVCNGQCVAASDCRTCAGAPLLCSLTGQCLSACSACTTADAGLPIECFACDQKNLNPVGNCQPNDTGSYCLSGSDFGAYLDGSSGYYCACTDAGANGCPGQNQVCAPLGRGQFCLSCGQVTTASLEEAGCSGGGSCNTALRTCQ